MVLLALQACGGGGDDAVAPVAAADEFTLAVGQSANLLVNDRIGDAPASTGPSGNATLQATTGLPAWARVVDGTLTVDAGAVAGRTGFSYTLCTRSDPGVCAEAAVVLNVPAPALTATADSFTLAPGGTADVLGNDTLNGAAADATRVTVTATEALPAGIGLSPGGVLAVSAAASAGQYSLNYRVCLIDMPASCATAGAAVAVPALASLQGRVIDAGSALGVEGASVAAAGISTTTDGAGNYTLAGLRTDQPVTVLFSHAAHAQLARTTQLSAGAVTDLTVRLVSLAAATGLTADAGGTATAPGGVGRLVLPPAAVQRADGSTPSGLLQLRLTPIDPSADPSLLPGDYGTLIGTLAALFESFGAIDALLVDADGAAVSLRSGQRATLRIPVATRASSPPATAALYRFDVATGRWLEDGSAQLAGTGASRYYEGTVSQLGSWTAGRPLDAVQVAGCLVDANGARVTTGRVTADGVNYSAVSTSSIDGAGGFSIAIRRNSTATVVAQANGLVSNTLRVGPFSADTALPSCLGLGQTAATVSLRLTWSLLPDDLDAHLYAPDGTEVYFGNRGALRTAPFAFQDVDDTSSYGPEVTTITRLMVGTYVYAVHNFSGQADGRFSASGARVELTVPGRATELWTPPTAGETIDTDWWRLMQIDVDARCNVSVRRIQTFTTSGPTPSTTGTATYCTP